MRCETRPPWSPLPNSELRWTPSCLTSRMSNRTRTPRRREVKPERSHVLDFAERERIAVAARVGDQSGIAVRVREAIQRLRLHRTAFEPACFRMALPARSYEVAPPLPACRWIGPFAELSVPPLPLMSFARACLGRSRDRVRFPGPADWR